MYTVCTCTCMYTYIFVNEYMYMYTWNNICSKDSFVYNGNHKIMGYKKKQEEGKHKVHVHCITRAIEGVGLQWVSYYAHACRCMIMTIPYPRPATTSLKQQKNLRHEKTHVPGVCRNLYQCIIYFKWTWQLRSNM